MFHLKRKWFITTVILMYIISTLNPFITYATEIEQENIEVIDVESFSEHLNLLGFEVIERENEEQLLQNINEQLRHFQNYYEAPLVLEANDESLQLLEQFTEDILQIGQENEYVLTLKEKLQLLDYKFDNELTQLFDEELEAIIQTFQEKHHLLINGMADQVTLDQIDELVEEIDFTPGVDESTVRDEVVEEPNLPIEDDAIEDEEEDSNISIESASVVEVDDQLNHNGFTNDTTEMDEVTPIKQTMMKATNNFIVLSNGMRHSNVKTFKRDLKKIGFPVPGNGTTLFGADTESQVKAFQGYYNLPVNGVVQEVTQNKINVIINSPLQYGKKHADTKKLKQDLQQIGYTVPGKGTTFYGIDTERVIKQFQLDHQLVINGIADEITLAKISSLKDSRIVESSTTLSKGTRSKAVQQLKKDLKKIGFPVPGKGTQLFGADTEKQVKALQNYYGLPVNGVVQMVTQNKINDIVNNPLQNGKKHQNTKKLKQDLKTIGYTVPGKGTTLYGKDTEKVVKQFQNDYQLVVNGIADDVTLAKIVALIKDVDSNTLSKGTRSKAVQQLKKDLMKIGFPVPGKGTELFGADTEKQVKAFQRYYGLPVNGVVQVATQNKIDMIVNSPFQKGKKHKDTKQLKKDLSISGYPVPGKGTTLYGADTEKVIKRLQNDYQLVVNGIADEVTLAKIKALKKESSEAKLKIFIDAGHGGYDSGALFGNLKEKTLTLDIAKRIEKHLSKYKNVTLRMSRTTDTTMSLNERTDTANAWKADFFFSVHINSFNSQAYGIESFIFNNKPTADEINKQNVIHNHISQSINEKDRGKKQANFHVLRESNMTAMLFEYLFIDHPSDGKKLSQASYREKLAKATAEGIAKAYNLK